MVSRILVERWTPAAAAAAAGVSTRTAYKWLARFRSEGLAGLTDRPSAPRRRPGRWPETWVATVLRLRRLRLTGAEIGERLGIPRSTVAAILARHGLARLKALDPKPPVVRYERTHAGELIHIDVKKLGKIDGVGHRITGDRRSRKRGIGWDFVHVAIDDASRLAYVEVLPDEKRHTATAFLCRAVRWFRAKGITVQRVMSDNGSAYVSKTFAKACRWMALKHIRTRPYTPKTNGKAERFIQTLMREWAYALPYRSSEARTADLGRWL
ncbi:MAG: IS481 family transposase, partial [Solirubrobacterales bacterium]